MAPDRRVAVVVALLLVGGLAIRLVGLTDPPIGFHPTRQYHGLNVARAMYVAKRSNISVAERHSAQLNRHREVQLEPPLLEAAVAAGYVVAGHEVTWLGRLYSALAWLAGALALFLVTRRVFDATAGVVAAAFFLLVPYGIEAGRSFQPDPLMICLTLYALLLIVRHHQQPSARALLAAAAMSAAAVFVKGVSVFPIAGVFAALAVARHGWRRLLREREPWLFGAVALLPSLAYYVYGVVSGGQLQNQFHQTFIPHLFLQRFFWEGWRQQIDTAVSLPIAAVALVGSLALARTRTQRYLVGGWWVGYLVYAASVPYHIATHDYYELPLIPIASTGVGIVAAAAATRLRSAGMRLAPSLLAVVLLAVLVVSAGRRVHPIPLATAHRAVATFERIGTLVNHSDAVMLLSGDYGYDIRYHGNLSGVSWPERIDDRLSRFQGEAIPSLATRFHSLARSIDARWFAVVDMNEWKHQVSLHRYLDAHAVRVASSSQFVLYRLDGAAT